MNDLPFRDPVVLTAGNVSLVLDVDGPSLPRVLHWGARVADAPPGDGTGPLHRELAVPLLPAQFDGWMGRPGVAGHRDGAGCHLRLEITEPESGKLRIRVESQLFRGVHYEIKGRDESGNTWLVHSTRKAEVDEHIGLTFGPEAIHVMRFGETEEEFDRRLETYGEGSHG